MLNGKYELIQLTLAYPALTVTQGRHWWRTEFDHFSYSALPCTTTLSIFRQAPTCSSLHYSTGWTLYRTPSNMSLAHLAPRADLPIIAGLAHPPRSAPGNKQFLANGEQNNSQQKRHEMIELAAMQSQCPSYLLTIFRR